jgi:D-sedoheptulose 7-phosphate isomerase
MQNFIIQEIQKLSQLLGQIEQNQALITTLEAIAKRATLTLQAGKKIMFMGNGGSAADAQHLATELLVRMRYSRPAMAALALTTDTSMLTAMSNDYSFDDIFARQIEGLGQAGDMVIGISTSGKSANVINGLKLAQEKGLIPVAFTGQNNQLVNDVCEYVIAIPSNDTQKVQECHIVFGHILCGLIEEAHYGVKFNPVRTGTNDKDTPFVLG